MRPLNKPQHTIRDCIVRAENFCFPLVSRITLPAAYCVLAVCAGCSGGTSGSSELMDVYTDSIEAGNLGYVEEEAGRRMSLASDSADYYVNCHYGTVARFLRGESIDLPADVRRIFTYASTHAEDPRLARLAGVSAGTLGAYYVKYNLQTDSAIHYIKISEKYLSTLGGRELFVSLGNLADAYFMSGEYDLSSDTYHRAISFADSIEADSKCYLALYGGLASCYTAIYDFEESAIWWKRLGELEPLMDVVDKFNYLNNLGNDFYLQKKYGEALDIFTELDSMLRGCDGMDFERHFCSANLCDVYLRLGIHDSVEVRIKDNLRYFSEELPSNYAYNHVVTQQMRLWLLKGDYAGIERLVRDNPIDDYMRREQLLWRYELLRDYYSQSGDWKKAFSYSEKHDSLDNIIRGERIRLDASERELKYRRDSEVRELRANLESGEVRHDRMLLMLTLGVVVIIALVVIIVLLRKVSRQREDRMMRKIMDLRLKSIRNRISPHFIYNILGREMQMRSQGKGSNLDAIVGLLRQQQVLVGELVAPLDEELGFIDNFVSVESMGIEPGVTYTLDVSPNIDVAGIMIPSMTLIIFVENAFKHGFSRLGSDEMRILNIRVRKDRYEGVDGVMIVVENNSSERTPATTEGTRQGLAIISSTLQILNGHKRNPIKFTLREWTDNLQHCGCCSLLFIPDNFNFTIQYGR